MKRLVSMAKLVLVHPVTLATATLYLATGKVIGLDGGVRVDHAARLLDYPTFEWSLPIRGRSRVAFGALRIGNADGRYDGFLEWTGGDWTVEIRETEIEESSNAAVDLAALDPVFSGRCAVPSWGEVIEVPLRDPMRGFDRALVTDLYAGDNVGTTGNEGGAELEAAVKPICLGYCRHVPPVPANAPGQRLQVDTGPDEEIVEAYAAGNATAHTDDLATGIVTFTTELDDTTPTVTVKGRKVGGEWLSTAADLIAWLATARAGVASVDAASQAAMATAAPDEVGYYAAERATVRAAADFLAAGSRLWYVTDALGVLRLGQHAAPAGEPLFTIRRHMLSAQGGEPFTFVRVQSDGGTAALEDEDVADREALADRRALEDSDGGLPHWRVTVRGARHWAGGLADNQIAQVLSDEAQAALKREWRQRPAGDETIADRYPGAPEAVIDTAFAHEASLQPAADAWWAILKWPQQALRLVVQRRYVPDGWILGSTMQVVHPRYGLAAGALFRVSRVRRAGPVVDLDVWRPLEVA